MIDLDAKLGQINRWRLPPSALDSLLDAQPEPPVRIPVTAGSNLQPIIDAAPIEAELVLEPGSYTAPRLDNLPVTLTAAYVPQRRVRVNWPSPVALVSGGEIRIGAGVRLAGIAIYATDPSQNIIRTAGANIQLDAVHILGDPLLGQRRGIAWNADGTFMRRSVVDQCFMAGKESQAVCGWSGCRNGRIDDCTLIGASQSVLWGGGDCPTPNDSPQNLVISRSLLTKRPEWFTMPSVFIKTAFECKNAWGCRLEDSICEYAGTSEQQRAYLMVMTPRNQTGNSPWAAVRDIVVERCLFRYGGGCVSFLGADDSKPSGVLDGVTIRNVKFDKVDPTGMTKGDGRGFTFNKGPRNVCLDGITVVGRNLKYLFYGVGQMGQPPMGLYVRNMAVAPGLTFGMQIDGGGTGLAAWMKWAPDTIIEDGTMTGAAGYPEA